MPDEDIPVEDVVYQCAEDLLPVFFQVFRKTAIPEVFKKGGRGSLQAFIGKKFISLSI